MRLVKQDLHGIIITTNLDSTVVEKGPASGSRNTSLVPNTPLDQRKRRLQLQVGVDE